MTNPRRKKNAATPAPRETQAADTAPSPQPDEQPVLSVPTVPAEPALPDTPGMASLLAHGNHVAVLAMMLFEQLASLHQLEEVWGQRLLLAARLHDIGMAEGRKGHHKASMRLIDNDLALDIPNDDRPWVALLARYHRKAWPSARHKRFASLKRHDRKAVARAAAILRIADALDYTHSGVAAGLTVDIRKHTVDIAVHGKSAMNCEPELKRARKKGDLFRHLLGKNTKFSCLPC